LRLLAGEPGWSTVERFSHGVPAQLLDRGPFNALRAIAIDKGRFGRLARRKVAFGNVVEVEMWTPIAAAELGRVFPRVRTLRLQYVPQLDELAPLAAIGCRELAIRRVGFFEDAYLEIEGLRELARDILDAPSPFEVVCFGDERYVRDDRGYLVRD
jgi:hypothetical protein